MNDTTTKSCLKILNTFIFRELREIFQAKFNMNKRKYTTINSQLHTFDNMVLPPSENKVSTFLPFYFSLSQKLR